MSHLHRQRHPPGIGISVSSPSGVEKLVAENRKLRARLRASEIKCKYLLSSNKALCDALQGFYDEQAAWDVTDNEPNFTGPLESSLPYVNDRSQGIPNQCGHFPQNQSHLSPSMVEDPDVDNVSGAIHSQQMYPEYAQNALQPDEAQSSNSDSTLGWISDNFSSASNFSALPFVSDDRLLHEPYPVFEISSEFLSGRISGALDEYISFVQQCFRENAIQERLTACQLKVVSKQCILWIVRQAWPDAEHFWKVTGSFQGFLAVELWRNFPSSTTYEGLHPAFRPTPTQLSYPHPAIIDWLPWPDIRDLLILCQDCINVDLVCKAAIHNVVAHRGLSGMPTQTNILNTADFEPKTLAVSFRVWDLCRLEEESGYRPSASDVRLEYQAKSPSVRALEQAYRLECADFHTQKLHPEFFLKYPALHCESAISTFTVQAIPAIQEMPNDVGEPKVLTLESREVLHGIVQHALKGGARCSKKSRA